MARISSGINQANSLLNQVTQATQRTSQIISTASRFPNASYGTASYSILQRLDSYIGATTQSIQNVQNASAMVKVAAGATSNTIGALTSIQQYLVNAANGTNSDSDRAAIQENINQLVRQIDDNARAEYNGMNLIDGSRNGVVVAGISGYENIEVGNMTSQALGLTDERGNVTISVANDEDIQGALDAVSVALDSARSTNDNLQSALKSGDILDYSLDEATTQGAYLQRLEYQINNYTTAEENEQAAASTMGDADIARHISQLRLQQIQQQVAVEVSKIFNHSQASVLSLLQ